MISAVLFFTLSFWKSSKNKILFMFEEVSKTMVHYNNRQHQMYNIKVYFRLWPVTARVIIYTKHNLLSIYIKTWLLWLDFVL